MDFRLAGNLVDAGQRAQRRCSAGWADEHRVAHGLERRPRRGREPHAYGIRPVVDNDRCGRGLAFNHRHADGAQVLGAESSALRALGIDREHHGWTARRVLDAVFNVDDGGLPADPDFSESVRHLRRPRAEKIRVRREQLDDDRLGRAGQVADHVLQHLREFDVEHRLGHPDLASDVADDLVDIALAIRLQLDRDVAGVRLGHGRQAELQTGAARRALHLRRGAQDGIDVRQHAVRLLQRASRRHDVVEHETALVEGRQEVGAQGPIARVRRGDQNDAQSQQWKWPLQRLTHGPFVHDEDSSEQAARQRCLLRREHPPRLKGLRIVPQPGRQRMGGVGAIGAVAPVSFVGFRTGAWWPACPRRIK